MNRDIWPEWSLQIYISLEENNGERPEPSEKLSLPVIHTHSLSRRQMRVWIFGGKLVQSSLLAAQLAHARRSADAHLRISWLTRPRTAWRGRAGSWWAPSWRSCRRGWSRSPSWSSPRSRSDPWCRSPMKVNTPRHDIQKEYMNGSLLFWRVREDLSESLGVPRSRSFHCRPGIGSDTSCDCVFLRKNVQLNPYPVVQSKDSLDVFLGQFCGTLKQGQAVNDTCLNSWSFLAVFHC